MSLSERRTPFLVGVVLVALAGCSAGVASPDPTLEANRELFAHVLVEAQAAEASDAQVAVLSAAAVSGELQYSDVADLFPPFFDCVGAIGGAGELYGTLEIGPGVTIPNYRVAVPDSALADDATMNSWDALEQACEAQHIAFVWKAIQLQPAAVEFKEQKILSHRAEIAACVAPFGYVVDDESTVSDIVAAVMNVRIEDDTVCFDFDGA